MSAIVIFDTEFTAWPGSRERRWQGDGEYRELIQLAALKITLGDRGLLSVQQSFNELICPKINPVLSDYIKQLTRIGQRELENYGVDFASALMAFYAFTGQGQLPCFSWGHDGEVLQENADLYGITWPHFEGGFYNLMPVFKRAGTDVAGYCSGDLHQAFDLSIVGQAHNALHDVRSLAASVEQLLVQGRVSWAELTGRCQSD